MVKFGRNDPCPCGSGRKFKKCCIQKKVSESNPAPPKQITVTDEINRLQKLAMAKEEVLKVIGVFIFFSTQDGDAWVLELTDMDALLVAKAGKKVDIEIDESSETIEINWSHRFAIKDKKFTTTAYNDNTVEVHQKCPAPSIHSSLKKIHKKYSSELLDSIHIDNK